MNYIEKLKRIKTMSIFAMSDSFWTMKRAILELNQKIEESKFNKVSSTNEVRGKYLVNFKNPDYPFGGNTALPANIEPYKGRLSVVWENGWSAVIDAEYINIYELANGETL